MEYKIFEKCNFLNFPILKKTSTVGSMVTLHKINARKIRAMEITVTLMKTNKQKGIYITIFLFLPPTR